jgi:TolA-binding protein
MTRNFLRASLFLLLCIAVAAGQSGPMTSAGGAGAQGAPVSYASVSQLNGLLSQLETTSKATQSDLVKLRIEKWKTDNSYKKQALGNVDSIQRNLQGALPEIIGQLRGAPEDLSASFKLYRNLDALYDVLGSVVEGAGAFGSKDDMQSLANDLNSFEGTRKQLAERIENLSSAKEAEINRLRADLKTAQAAIPVAPPKKIVIDDTQPEKKPPAKKKSTAKKPDTAKPAAGQIQQDPAKPQ